MLAGAAGEIEDMTGGDDIEGQAFAQVIGVIELPFLHLAAALQGSEILLDGPSSRVPSKRLHGVLQGGLPLSLFHS